MNLNNFLSIADALILVPAASYDETAVAQTGIDILAYDGVGLFIFNAALGTGTTPTLNVHLEHSDDDETYADVTDGAFTQVTGAAGDGVQVLRLNVANLKQYVRAVPVIAGTTPDFVLSMEFVGIKQATANA